MADATKLEAVLDHIRMNPKEHDQSTWGAQTDCGTTMCFAGTAVHLAGYPLIWEKRIFEDERLAFYCKVPDSYTGKRVGDRHPDLNPDYDIACIHEVATHELGLDYDEAHELFWNSDTFDEIEEAVKGIINNNQSVA